MMNAYIYSPHYDFYMSKVQAEHGYSMSNFHMHKKYEIYYQISGSRRYVIDNGTYFINAGSMVLIDKTEIHKTVCVNDDMYARYVVNFSDKYLEAIGAALGGVNLMDVFQAPQKVLNLNLKQRASAEGLLGELYALRENGTPQQDAMRLLKLSELLLKVRQYLDALPKQAMDEVRVPNRVVCDITNYVSSHYREELTLNNISRQLGLSPCYVSRVYKRETGTGLMEYISIVRLRAAKELLETTRLSVGDIAERSGFSTTGHFTYKFREACGMPPSEYRRLFAVNP